MVIRIGLAMLQGARHEHVEALYNAALELDVTIDVVPLRSENNILESKLDGIVLPGGESTTMRKASESHGLLDSIFNYMDDNPSVPILGTCAGAILLLNPEMERVPYIDAEVDRNAYGRQRDSFQTPLNVKGLIIPSAKNSGTTEEQILEGNHWPLPVKNDVKKVTENFFHGVFIRAPRFTNIGPNVKQVVFNDGEAVGLFQNNKLALSFHPELTTDYRFHRWLLNKAIENN